MKKIIFAMMAAAMMVSCGNKARQPCSISSRVSLRKNIIWRWRRLIS